MGYPRLRAPSFRWRPWALSIGLLLGVLAVTAAGAQGTARSFVQDPYYLGSEGGQPPSLLEFSAEPSAYLRNDAAYAALRQRFADVLGRDSLSETDFRALFSSGQVRAERLCSGSINTAGILPNGHVSWTNRPCYSGERLIEVLVGSEWVVVASQGCFNPVRILPPPPAEPSGELVCRMVSENSVIVDGSRHQHLNGVWHQNCCCDEHPHFTRGFTSHHSAPGSAGGVFRQCVWVSN